MQLIGIGYVNSVFKKPHDSKEMRKHRSEIIIEPRYVDGLYKIGKSDFIKIIFYFYNSEEFALKRERRNCEVRRVFASRSPHRPNPIGSTTVKLLNREKEKLEVAGLDAIDGTPVLDIKPFSKNMDTPTRFKEDNLE